MNTSSHACLVALTLAFLAPLSFAAHPVQDSYRAAAKVEDPGFKDFSASAGQKLYTSKGASLACTSCHTDSPLSAGKHASTGKEIAPLAPAANPKRFTDPANVEKWFKRNCNDVFKRACTAQEKGDFIAYVLSVK